jgi:hypothetical protein
LSYVKDEKDFAMLDSQVKIHILMDKADEKKFVKFCLLTLMTFFSYAEKGPGDKIKQLSWKGGQP